MKVTDPVCQMQIDVDKVASQEEHGGWAYFFCSLQCHRLFKAHPQRYVGRGQRFAASSTAATERDNHE